MLSVKQLKDIAKCGEIKDCKQCSAFRYCVDEFDLCKALAETALVYREMLEQLEWIEDENGRLYCPVCNVKLMFDWENKESEVE